MKNHFAFAIALGLLTSVSASAQNHDRNGNESDASAPHADHGSTPSVNGRHDQGRATSNGHAMTGNTHTRTPDTHQNAAGNRSLPASGDVHPSPQSRSTADRTQYNSGRSGNTTGHQPAINSRQGSSNWSGNAAAHHPDVAELRRNMQATRRFRGGSYNAPEGYQSRHWSYGERLPRGYFVRNYWIASFMTYGLFAPPSGLVWVRVGDDALLIDPDTGEIVQVRYGIFY